jgi:hypothetical protein
MLLIRYLHYVHKTSNSQQNELNVRYILGRNVGFKGYPCFEETSVVIQDTLVIMEMEVILYIVFR